MGQLQLLPIAITTLMKPIKTYLYGATSQPGLDQLLKRLHVVDNRYFINECQFKPNTSVLVKMIFKEVKAKPVSIMAAGTPLDTFIKKSEEEKQWVVSEGITGGKLATGKTQAQAIDNAQATVNKVLDQQGKLALFDSLIDLVNRFGLSPRYAYDAEGHKADIRQGGAKIKTPVLLKVHLQHYKPFLLTL